MLKSDEDIGEIWIACKWSHRGNSWQALSLHFRPLACRCLFSEHASRNATKHIVAVLSHTDQERRPFPHKSSGFLEEKFSCLLWSLRPLCWLLFSCDKNIMDKGNVRTRVYFGYGSRGFYLSQWGGAWQQGANMVARVGSREIMPSTIAFMNWSKRTQSRARLYVLKTYPRDMLPSPRSNPLSSFTNWELSVHVPKPVEERFSSKPPPPPKVGRLLDPWGDGSRSNHKEEFFMCPLVLATCISYWVLGDLGCIMRVGWTPEVIAWEAASYMCWPLAFLPSHGTYAP